MVHHSRLRTSLPSSDQYNMKVFLEARIALDRPEELDIAVARLSLLGFDGFVEEQGYVLAYKEHDSSIIEIKRKVEETGLSLVELKEIEDQNWNARWEESFNPVLIDDKVMIRAPFHKMHKGILYDIIIEPKMSFGTAHHETTYMMLQLMLQLELEGKLVLDMGCGTAVLAILAKLKHAASVTAIDNDEWAFQNAKENCDYNQVDIRVELGDASSLKGRHFDIIFANINRNILLEDIPEYVLSLNKGGKILLSGFYFEDLEMIKNRSSEAGLAYENHIERNKWVAVIFTRK